MAEKDRFRRKQVLLRLSEEEYATIQQKAFEAEMNISDAVRSLIIFGSVKKRVLSDKSLEVMETANSNIRESINAMNKIGTNLNRIAYYTNVVGDADKQIVEEALQHTREINGELLKCYKKIKELCDANSFYT